MDPMPDARTERANAEDLPLVHRTETQMGLTHVCISGATLLSVERGLFDLRAALETGEVFINEKPLPTQDGTWMCCGTITQAPPRRAVA